MRTHWNVSVRSDWIGIWKCSFLRREVNRSTRRKTSRSKGENQQQTQPTYGVDARIRTRATLVGGECSHHFAQPCSQKWAVRVELVNLSFCWTQSWTRPGLELKDCHSGKDLQKQLLTAKFHQAEGSCLLTTVSICLKSHKWSTSIFFLQHQYNNIKGKAMRKREIITRAQLLNVNPGFFFFLSKALSRIIFSILLRVSSHQVLGKEN